jgi:hypothetical protein
MPYTFSIDAEAGVIREIWTGEVTLADLEASCHDEWKHPDYVPGLNLISDFRNAYSNLSAEEVLRFASWFSDEDAPRKHAIVVSKQTGLDLAGIFSMIRESAGDRQKLTQMFFSPVAAEAWVVEA